MNERKESQRPPAEVQPELPALPLWVSFAVVFGALLIAAGGVIAAFDPALLVGPGEETNSAVRVYAGYLTSRNLVLAIMLVAALVGRAKVPLVTLMLFTGAFQIVDAGIDCVEGRWSIVPGILLFGLIFLLGAARLSARLFWKPRPLGP